MNYLIGQQIEHYQVEALLGEGGMGSVYRALDLKHDRPVALKVMHAQLSQQPQFQQRFAQEAQSVFNFNSASIIKIYDFDTHNDVPYIAMEYVAGGNLTSYLQQLQWSGKKMGLAEVIALGAQVAEGLAYAHQRGVVHRDVKPDNILFRLQADRSGKAGVSLHQAVITDFGLAILLTEGEEAATNPFMGSLPYMSPEQCTNASLDGRTDLYSLGVMLYQLATGQLPFKINAPADIVKHVEEPPLPPSLINPDIPEAVETIILKTLAKKPGERYQTGAELAHTLRQAASSADVSPGVARSVAEAAVTQWVERRWVAGVDVGSRVDVHKTWITEGNFRLFIAHQWEPSRVQGLNKDAFTIGRSPNNDIVLDDGSVSGTHVKLERTESGWQVRDLGSTNGTYLENTPLEYDKPVNWAGDQTLRVGPYALQWQAFKKGEYRTRRPMSAAAVLPLAVDRAPERRATQTVPPPIISAAVASMPEVEIDEVLPVSYTSDVLSVSTAPREMEIEPGTETVLQMTVRNLGLTVDDITLRVAEKGLPVPWIALDQTQVKLLPDESSTVTAVAVPPQDSTVLAGEHIVQFVATTSRGEQETSDGHIQVDKWEDSVLDMHPTNLQEKVTCRLNINDRSNFENTYNIAGLDDSDALTFNFDEPPNVLRTDVETQQQWIKLAAGEEGSASFTIEPKRRAWFGRNKIYPYEMRVRTETSEWQTLFGQVEISPRISPRVLLFFIALILLLGLGGYYGYTWIQEQNRQELQRVTAENEALLAAAREQADAAQAEADAAKSDAELAEAAVEEAIAEQRSAEEIAALQAEAASAAAEADAAEGAAQDAAAAEAAAASAAAQSAAAEATAAAAAPGASPTPSNVAPTGIQLDITTIPEDSPVGTVVGTFTTVDPGSSAITRGSLVASHDPRPGAIPSKSPATFRVRLQSTSFAYKLVAGSGDNDNAAFVISDDSLKTAILLDFETKSVYSIRVQTDDGQGGVFEQAFIISVTDENDVPTFSSLPIITGRQDVPYNYNIIVSDPDANDTTRITGPTLPSWLTLTDNGNNTALLDGLPTNAEVGDHDVTLLATDSAGETDTQTFVLTVVNINDPPMFSSTAPTSATQDQLYNYSIITTFDPDANDVLTISSAPLPLPSWLTLTDNRDGTAVLNGTPGNADVGSHSITLQVADSSGATDTQTFTLDVANVNDQPVFSSIPVGSVLEDSPYNYNITTTDPDEIFGDTRTISMLSLPLPGWLTFLDNGNGTATLSGLPTNSDVGNYLITLEVMDVARDTDTQSFTIDVINVNDPPTANVDSITVDEGNTATMLDSGSSTLLGNDTDPDPPGNGNLLTVSPTPLTGPTNGTLTLNADGTFSYVHDDSETTSDSFIYEVCDDGTPQLCDSALVNITVNPVNDPPINAVPTGVLTTDEDTPLVISGVSVSDADLGTGDIQVTLTANNGTLTLNVTAGLTFSVGNGTNDATMTFTGQLLPVNTALGAITYDPTPDYNGMTTVDITSDDQDLTNPQQDFDPISINVLAINDPPTFDPISDETIPENSGVTSIVLTNVGPGGGADEAGQTLVFTAVSGNNPLIPNSSIGISGSGITRTLTFGPPATNLNGVSIITVTANDNSGGTQTHVDTFQVTVIAVNDPPTFNAISNQTLTEGNVTPQTVSITGVGPGGGPDEATQCVTVSATSNDTNIVPDPSVTSAGCVSASTRTLTFNAANANASGTVIITVTAVDSGGTGNPGDNDTYTDTFQVTINNINDPPFFNAINNRTMNEDATPPTITITGVGPGGGGYESSQTVTLSATSNNQSIIPNASISITGSGSSRTLTFTPQPHSNGVVIVTVTATDNGGTANGGVDTFQRTFQVTINALNDAPVFNQISNPPPVLEDSGSSSVTITGVAPGPAGATDETGQTVNVTASSSDTNLIPNPAVTGTGSSRTLTFTPNSDAHGTVNITVTATDNGPTGGSHQWTFSRVFAITITPINDAPFFDPIGNQTVLEDPGTTNVTITGVDPGGGGFETSQNVAFTATSNNVSIIPNPTVTGSGSSRTLSFTPVSNANGGPVIITVVANDGGGTTNGGVESFQRTFQIMVTAVNDAPTVPVNTGITLAGIVTVNISSSNLRATDVDHNDLLLLFTVTRIPVRGTLLRNSVPLSLGSTFTQADINAGLIAYAHTASGSADDEFRFTVRDPALATTPEQTFNITVN
jgi:serine/threonine protein kinase